MSGYNFTGEIGWDHSRAELMKFLDEVDRELEESRKKAEGNRQETKKTEAVDNGEQV